MNTTKSTLWILTEERPKRHVIGQILYSFSKDHKIPCFIDTIRILPILNSDRTFSFLYEVIGYKSETIKKVFIKTVSGYSSFIDFLLFYQDDEPDAESIPLYGIEETKTDDAESRNTGIFQRATKFVYIEYFYPQIRKIMLYNLQIDEKKKPTQTNIFGTKCLLTLGVELIGKKHKCSEFTPFKSVDELIHFKNSMKKPPGTNVPITLRKTGNSIEVSGRLYKSNGLAHDPNIGALSLICATLRKLGWTGKLIITKHGLQQKHVKSDNKFICISNRIQVDCAGLTRPPTTYKKHYWKSEKEGEKLGTIFIHLVVENFTSGSSIFENHAGCEKGYFITQDGNPIALEKYSDRAKYKSGKKDQIIAIPDLILIDFERSEIINIEGKKYQFCNKGIKELKDFDAIEQIYIKKYYPDYKIVRTVVLYGGTADKIEKIEVGFLLNSKGNMVLSVKSPRLFQEAIKNLVTYWGLEKKTTVEKSDLFFSDIISDEKMPNSGKFNTHLPVYSLKAVATVFSEQQTPELLGWKEVDTVKKLDKHMFIAQVVGKSMQPTIPDGSFCIFRYDLGGSRNGKVVLVESRQVSDPETHQKFTIKRYRSEKKHLEDGRWQHKKIRLVPDNKQFSEIVLENVSEDDFRVVAEFVQQI
jgi:hypothetical protein